MVTFSNKHTNISSKKMESQQKKILKLHDKLIMGEIDSPSLTSWIDWPESNVIPAFDNIEGILENWKNKGVKKLIMIGIGGSYLGGKAMLDFLKLDSALNPDILFAGNDLSSSKMIEISDFIKNEEYAIVMTSKSGKTLEPSLSFEYFVDKLKQQKPTNYAERVLVITEKDSLLDNAATAAGYLKSEFIDGIGGRFSGLTPLGLIPAMFKGVNYKDIIIGAKKANKDLISDPVNASAYKYATTRYLLSKKLTTEFFIAYESENLTLLDWLMQLFGESEGKEGKGLIPSKLYFTQDLHSMGQLLQEGKKTFFETTIWVKEALELKVPSTVKDHLKINYLSDRTLNSINHSAMSGTIEAHWESGNVPNLIIEIDNNSPETIGYLYQWFFWAVTMSALLLGVDPFNQPGVEKYKENMSRNLNK